MTEFDLFYKELPEILIGLTLGFFISIPFIYFINKLFKSTTDNP